MKTEFFNLSQELKAMIEGTMNNETNLRTLGATGDYRDDARLFIQEALMQDRETIVVPNGFYTFKEVHLNRSAHFVGKGKFSVFKLPTDLDYTVRGTVDGQEAMKNAMFLINTGNIEVTFENMTFDGDCFEQIDPHNAGSFLRIYKPNPEEGRVKVTFKNCNFINVNHSAIQAYGSYAKDYITIEIEGCTFLNGLKGTHTSAITSKWPYGYAPHFIGVYDSVTVRAEGNRFMDDSRPNNTDVFARIALYASVTATATTEESDMYSSSLTFTNNLFRGLGRSDAAGNGLGVLDMYVNGENVIVTGNKFFDSQMQSIRGKVNVKNLVVSGNIVKDGIDGAIAFHPNNYATKKGNVVIANNVVENCLGYGILLNGESATDPAPYFENAIVSGNLVNGIGVVPYRATLANGIFLKSVRGVTVADNQFRNIQFDGVYLETVENVKITGNVIHTTTTDAGIGRGIYGTGLYGAITIIGNDIKGNISAVYLTFRNVTTDLKRHLIMDSNDISEVRTASGQAVYAANFIAANVTNNIVEGIKTIDTVQSYAFNFKGTYLNLIGNMYLDVTGENKDSLVTQYGIKLKANVTTLKEIGNSWQTT